MRELGENITTLTRPLVTITFAVVLAVGFILGKVTQEQFIPIVTMVVAFWFGQRIGEQGATRK